MTQPGERPITLPHHKGRDYSKGLTAATSASGPKLTDVMAPMNYTAEVHFEDGSYWAQVRELPGCFASGDTLDELFAGLREAIQLTLDDADAGANLHVASAILSSEPVPA